MERKPMDLTAANMSAATGLSSRRVAEQLKVAHEIESDARREQRLRAQECKNCFYNERVAGCAMTLRPCAACGVGTMFSSTDADALCKPCASERLLCKHCGGDIDMNYGRANWPTSAPVGQGSAR